MKKLLTIAGWIAVCFAFILCLLAGYIYTMDLGVNYKGRARLDYNWKYYFAACPKKEYKHDGILFSFSYPSSSPKSPIHAFADSITVDDHLVQIEWSKDAPASIKSELSVHLASGGTDLPPFSAKFRQWVLREPDKEYLDPDKVYDTHLEKLNFKNGGSAILMSAQSKVEQRPHSKFLLGMLPGGYVFMLRNMVRYNASEATYRELGMSSYSQGRVYPDAARDAKSACVLKRVLETFEFKK